ncbi:MAG: cytochrome P450 [Alphaproteobacteria bacterium]|nr:cytochrome P450 [Alphaproteobacteria bacterium]
MATLAPAADTNVPLEAIDVSDALFYATDSWRPVFARLRQEAPVHFQPNSPFGPFWSVTRHADIQAVEARPDIFSSDMKYGGITVLDQVGEINRPQFIAADRPYHGEQRRVIAPAFGPGEMAKMAQSIRLRTAELLDGLPFGEEFNWVQRVSIPLTTDMLAILFDFPWADRHLLTFWSDIAGDIEMALNPETAAKSVQHGREMLAYFDRLFAQRKALPPTNDLISMMVHSESMGNMPDQERIGNLILLIVGGNDTTRNSMSGMVAAFDRYPEQWRKLITEPAKIAGAVPEIIRWQTPLAHMRRTCVADSEIAGVPVKAGDKIVMWYISGNRDESVFPDAERFDIERANARRHLSFGFGVHRCVGARLAELQIQILLEQMLERRMTVRVTGQPEHVVQCFVHGYTNLPVTIERH